MRILYISHTNAKDGSVVALANIIREMRARGHEVAVVTIPKRGYFTEEMERLGVKCFMVNFCMSIYPFNRNILLYIPRLLYMMARQLYGIIIIKKILQAFTPDIVHTNVGPLSVGYYACKGTGIPHVWHQREFMDRLGLKYFPSYSIFQDNISSEFNHNISITKTLFDYLHLTDRKDTVIYDGVFNKDTFENMIPVDREKNILFVGRVERSKGLFELIVAFSKFHKIHPEYTLEIIGEKQVDAAKFYKECCDYINSHSLQDSVSFLGKQSDVFQFMAKAKMLVMCSEFEGFGFVTAEAMACECPVIGRNTTGTKEQMDNGLSITGKEIALRFNNTDELVNAMVEAAENDMTDMCKMAHDVVFNLYTTDKNVDNIEAFYKRIIYKR